MTRVSSTEHVLLLLRERLQRMERGRAGQAKRTGKASGWTPSPMARLQALSVLDNLSGEERRRTLVRAILTEELGEDIANDASFQAVAEEVDRMNGDTDEGRALMEAAEQEVRAR
jgi:hypothetical protein